MTINNEWKFHVDTAPAACPADLTRFLVQSFPFNKGYHSPAPEQCGGMYNLACYQMMTHTLSTVSYHFQSLLFPMKIIASSHRGLL